MMRAMILLHRCGTLWARHWTKPRRLPRKDAGALQHHEGRPYHAGRNAPQRKSRTRGEPLPAGGTGLREGQRQSRRPEYALSRRGLETELPVGQGNGSAAKVRERRDQSERRPEGPDRRGKGLGRKADRKCSWPRGSGPERVCRPHPQSVQRLSPGRRPQTHRKRR